MLSTEELSELEDAQRYDFRKLQYDPLDRVVLFESTSHSGYGNE